MSFAVPSLSTIVERISDDLNSRLPGEDARLRRSVLYVLARVLAAVAWSLYQYQSWISRQVLPDTADTDSLDRHATIWGLTRIPATFTHREMMVTALAGSTLPAGSIAEDGDGNQFATDAIHNWAIGGTEAVPATAVIAGVDANLATGTILTLASPPVGVTAICTIGASGQTDGADTESDDNLRVRIHERIAVTPQGGAEADYVAWARAALAATDRVFLTTGWAGPGTLLIRFTVHGTGHDPIPTAGEVTTVMDYIEAVDADGYSTRRPVTADVTVAAPTADPIPFSIELHVLSGYGVVDVRAAIILALAAMLREYGEPSATVVNGHVHEAIAGVEGIEWYILLDVDGGGPTADITPTTGAIPTVGAITWS
jgi:uncharacterized phage protein gp47/JayE